MSEPSPAASDGCRPPRRGDRPDGYRRGQLRRRHRRPPRRGRAPQQRSRPARRGAGGVHRGTQQRAEPGRARPAGHPGAPARGTGRARGCPRGPGGDPARGSHRRQPAAGRDRPARQPDRHHRCRPCRRGELRAAVGAMAREAYRGGTRASPPWTSCSTPRTPPTSSTTRGSSMRRCAARRASWTSCAEVDATNRNSEARLSAVTDRVAELKQQAEAKVVAADEARQRRAGARGRDHPAHRGPERQAGRDRGRSRPRPRPSRLRSTPSGRPSSASSSRSSPSNGPPARLPRQRHGPPRRCPCGRRAAARAAAEAAGREPPPRHLRRRRCSRRRGRCPELCSATRPRSTRCT